MAIGLHGGLLFAFAGQTSATTAHKSRTEISILDLPSVSGTTRIDALPVAKIPQNKNASIKPIKTLMPKRLENAASAQRTKNLPTPNQVEPLDTKENTRKLKPVKIAGLSTQTKPQYMPQISLPNEANRTSPLANELIKTNRTNKEKLSATKLQTTIISKLQPKSLPASMEPAKTPIRRQNTGFKKDQSTITARPAAISSDSRPAKPAAKSKLKSTNDSKPTVVPTSKAKTAARMTTKIFAKSKIPIEKIEPTKIKVQEASKVTTHPAPAKPAAIPVQSTPIRTNRIKSASFATKVVSQKPSAIATIAKPRRMANYSKKPEKIAKVAIKNSATRISSIKSVKQQIKKPTTSSNPQPNNLVAMIARPNQVIHELHAAPTKSQFEDFAKVIGFLKYHKSDNDCFIALPLVSNYERMELIGFSNEKGTWPRFQEAITQSTKFQIPGRINFISDAQCQVIKFVRQNKSYPSLSVSIKLDQYEIRNGDLITGELYINEGRYLSYYVVDDEGTAISINRFVEIGENKSSFKLKINLSGGEVATSQLLLAIVTSKPLRSTRFPDPIPVNYLLKNIQKETASQNFQLKLALSAFLVK